MQFELNGHQYQSGKLDAFKQFHVARRLAPLLSGVSAALKDGIAPPAQAEGTTPDAAVPGPKVEFADFLEPMADALAHMPDADCDYVLFTCLSVVQRQQGSGWAKLVAQGSRSMMFEDIDMGEMIGITLKVIQENIGSFFAAPGEPVKP